jgi:hypothetical protein
VLRRLANLGAGYPEVVSVLETAQRQRNLAGELVVDAVPIAGSGYLEAVMGKDITGKRDAAVKRTSGSSRRRFFGLFGGEPDPPSKRRSVASQNAQAPLEMPPLPDPTPTTGSDGPAGTNAINGDSKPASKGKRDEAVERTSGDEPQPRRRLSDFFRKNDDS